MEKITYVAALNTAIATLSADPAMTEVVEKLTALKDQTEKRSNAVRKPSKAQIAKAEDNKALAATLYNALFLSGTPTTVAEIRKMEQFADLSAPKVTALLKILILDAKVTKDDSGRVAKYTAVA
jgi:hypothetical protein